MIASDYLTQIINHPSYPGAIAFAAAALALAWIIVTLINGFKD